MTEDELRQHHRQLFRFITSERLMRLQVFPEGHPKREKKLAECDNAMAALDAIKGFAKQHATARQPALIEME